MAVTVTANLSIVSGAESASDNGTWSGNSGGQDLEVKVQGNASYTWQASKNNRTSCTFTPTSNMDMSATGTHLYWWAKNDVAPFMEDKTTGTSTASGYTIRLTDGSSNYTEWHIAGADTWGGEWKCFVLDLSDTTQVYASSGTLDLSDIDVITWYVDISNSGNIRIIDNQWNDVVRFGTGLTLTGTNFDLSDAAAIDENSSYRYGILEVIDGVIFCQGKITIGNGATTTTFNSSNEVLVYRDRAGDGEGIISSSLYELVFTGSGCTADIESLTARGAGSTDRTRFALDASDTNADVTMSGCNITRAGLVEFVSGSDIQNTVFNDCLQITPSTSTFQYNTISNYAGSEGGALYWPGGTTVKNSSFLSNSQAIEVTQTSNQTYDALTFSGNTYDTHLNNGGTDINISKNNSSNPTTYTATGGGTVTYVGSSVSVTVHAVTSGGTDIENARVLLKASDGTGPFPYQESVTIANSGTTATVTHTSHGMATGDYVGIEGASLTANNGVFQITVSDTNTYTYTMGSSPGSSPTGTITSTFVALFGLTNSSGIVTDSRVYATDQPVIGWVRKSSSSPYYRTSNLVGTVDDVNGYSATAVMISDE